MTDQPGRPRDPADPPGSDDRPPGQDDPGALPPMPPEPEQPRGFGSYPAAQPPHGGFGVPKPGVIPLRPLNLTDILDGAISTMRAHPKPMLGVSAIVVVVSQLLVLLATWPLISDLGAATTLDQNSAPSEVFSVLGAAFAVTGVALLVTLLARVFLAGFLTLVVGRAVLGQPTGFAEVWTQVRPNLLRLLGLTLLLPLAAILLFVPAIVLTALVPPLGVLVLIATVVVAVWLFVSFALATPALVLENAGVTDSLRRSWRLVRGTWWRVFGILLLAGLIAAIVGALLQAPFTVFSGGFSVTSAAEPITFGSQVVVAIGAIIAGTITEPFAAAVTALLYTDQRMRREGMDIELARMAAGMPPSGQPG